MVMDSQLEGDVNILKEWYSKQHHLPQNIGDAYFYNFVSGTNSLQKAKKKIDAYFTLRKDVVEVFRNVNPDTMVYKDHCQSTGAVVLPETTEEGYRVIFIKTWETCPEKFHVGVDALRILQIGEISLDLWPCDTNFVVIEDAKWRTPGAVRTVDLRHLQSIVTFMQKGLPVKMKKYCVINAPIYTDTIVQFLKTFMPNKLRERVHVDSDDKKLREVLTNSIIPSEYGGEGKSLKEMDAEWTELINSRRPWFEEKLKLVTDENKRPKDAYSRETLDFGVDGSFKTLSID